MKRTLVLAVVFVLGLVLSADAQVTTTTKTKVTDDKVVEKTEVKTSGVKAKETVTTTQDAQVTKTEIKGKKGELKREEKVTEGKV